jgi:hypothetical protein
MPKKFNAQGMLALTATVLILGLTGCAASTPVSATADHGTSVANIADSSSNHWPRIERLEFSDKGN